MFGLFTAFDRISNFLMWPDKGSEQDLLNFRIPSATKVQTENYYIKFPLNLLANTWKTNSSTADFI